VGAPNVGAPSPLQKIKKNFKKIIIKNFKKSKKNLKNKKI
jgi:hypothetical protein